MGGICLFCAFPIVGTVLLYAHCAFFTTWLPLLHSCSISYPFLRILFHLYNIIYIWRIT